MKLVISIFSDGSWGSDPEDGKFAARLWTQSGTVCPPSWYQGCTHPETRRYNVHNSLSTVTRGVDFYNSWKCHPNVHSHFLFALFFPSLLTIIIIYQKGCFYLILFYSRIFSNSLLLFEFGVAGKISKYFIKYHRLNLTTSFLISLLSKLGISAKQVCLLFVRFILFSPTTRALSAPSEPPFHSDSKIYPSLLQNLTKCMPMPENWLQLLLATPLLEMPLQWFSDFSK